MKFKLAFFAVLFFMFVYVSASIVFYEPEYKKFGTNQTAFETNFSVNQSNIGNLTFIWNGENYTFHKDDLGVFYSNNYSDDSVYLKSYSSPRQWEKSGLSEGLILAMTLNNNSFFGENSTYVADLSGSGINGTVYNAVYVSSGKYGGAYSFDGSGDYIATTRNILNGTNAFTFSVWTKPSVFSGWAGVIGKRVSDTNVIALQIDTGGDIFCDVDNGTSNSYCNSANVLSEGNWYHIVMVYNGSGSTNSDRLKIYVNGTNISLTYSGTIPSFTGSTNTDFLNIGQLGPTSVNFYNGVIDDVRIWNRSLGEQEITQLYQLNIDKFFESKWNFQINQTKNSTSGLDNGTYTYQVFVTNSSGNSIYSLLRKVVVDQNYPELNFINNTPVNYANLTNSHFEINLSINEGDILDLTYNWNETNFTIYNRSLILMLNFDNRSDLGENDIEVVDISNEENNGIVYGATWSDSGKYGGAYNFSSSLINITNLSDMGLTQSVWVKNLTDLRWYFLVNSSGLLYTDGYLGGTKSLPISNSTGQVIIGENFSGLIDEVIIWNRSLSALEISQMYMVNLRKLNSTQWNFYVNQTKNSTSGLDNGDYNYQVFITDLASHKNQTEKNSLTINVNSVVSSNEDEEVSTQTNSGGGNYISEQGTSSDALKIRAWISPNKTVVTKIKNDKGTGIKELELKSKNWLSGEISILAYKVVPDFCSIDYQGGFTTYKVLDFVHTIEDDLIDSGRVMIGIEKDWIYSNQISEIKFVKCSPVYEEIKSSYEFETDEEGVYNVFINGFSTFAILGTLEASSVVISDDKKEDRNYESIFKIIILFFAGVLILGIIFLLIKHRIYFKEKIHSKFFDFEFKFRLGR